MFFLKKDSSHRTNAARSRIDILYFRFNVPIININSNFIATYSANTTSITIASCLKYSEANFSSEPKVNNNNNNNNNNNKFPETRKYWVDVQRGIVSSHGERDPL